MCVRACVCMYVCMLCAHTCVPAPRLPTSSEAEIRAVGSNSIMVQPKKKAAPKY